MASSDVDAFLKGAISGYTTSLDMNTGYSTDVASAATGIASNEKEAAGDGEGEQYTTGRNSGVRYGLPENNRPTQLQIMLAHTANEYIDSGDMSTALKAGSKAVQDHNNMHWRATQAAGLDDQGFDPHGIQSWIVSGDNKDLVTGMGQQIVNINGKNVRMDAKDALAYTENQQKQSAQSYIDAGDSLIPVDAQGHPIQGGQAIPKSLTPDAAASNQVAVNKEANDVLERYSAQLPQGVNATEGRQKGSDGVMYDVSRDATGFHAKAVEAKELTAGQSSPEAKAANDRMSTLETRVNSAISDDKNLTPITGSTGGIGKPAVGSEYFNTRGKDQTASRQLYKDLQEQDAIYVQSAVAAAKAGGQSGINTQGEIDRAAKSAPQLDYSSTDALKASLADRQDYWHKRIATLSGGSTGNTGEASKSSGQQIQAGYTEGGYKFNGGDPSIQSNWSKL